MNRKQLNQQATGNAVTETCNTYNSVWSGSVLFSGNVAIHINKMGEISVWQGKQAEAIEIKSMTQNKRIMRGLMTTDGLILVTAIKALAAENGDVELAGSVDYSRRMLNRMNDSQFLTACAKILLVTNNNKAALAAHNVTAAMITNFTADIATYTSISPKARAKRTDTATATFNLGNAMRDMLNHLKNKLDLNIEMFKNTPFYTAYKNSRQVIDLGNNGSGIKGTVTDKATGRVLKGILVEIVELNRKKFSNVRGNFSFKQVPTGNYTIRVRGENFVTTEFTDVQLIPGTLIDFDMVIEENVVKMEVGKV